MPAATQRLVVAAADEEDLTDAMINEGSEAEPQLTPRTSPKTIAPFGCRIVTALTLALASIVGLVAFVVMAKSSQGKTFDPHDVQTKVHYGNKISDWYEERDFVARVNIRVSATRSGICTGTVFDNKVLTAAHCVADARASDVTVKLSSKPDTWLQVAKIDVHPDYPNQPNAASPYDLAVLTLQDSHQGKKHVVLDAVVPAVGEQIRYCGFGLTHTGDVGEDLYCTGPIRRVDCYYEDGLICSGSGPTSQVTTCFGDSGGPWFQLRNGGRDVELVGVLSFGFDGECGDASAKAGFVSVAAMKDWIVSKIQNMDSRDPTGCRDADKGRTDIDGDGCEWYTKNDLDGNHCGRYDDDDFDANIMCCRCGGGDDASGGCRDSLKTSFSINGRPASCSHLKNYCNHYDHGTLIKTECPLTCGACQV